MTLCRSSFLPGEAHYFSHGDARNLAFLENDKRAQPEVTFVFTIAILREISYKDKLCMARVV